MAQDPSTADAFAISPISARASLPSEADYDAIREAFMETARGRWFLTEYAKRNRNADTGMVLDAVARIEASVAARGPASPSPAALIAMIRPMIAEARTAADAALNAPDAAETIAAAGRGVRIIREISWSLRETGTDPRICNILDAQVLAFDRVNNLASDTTPREMIGEAFDDLILKLEEIGSGIRTAQRETPAPVPEPIETVGANLDGSDAVAQPQTAHAGAPAPADVLAEPTLPPTADQMAEDDAVLDLIAMEMAAPEIDDADDFGGDDALAELQSLAEAAPQPAPTRPAPTMPSSAMRESSQRESPHRESSQRESSLKEPALRDPALRDPALRDPATSAAVATAPDSLGASLLTSGVVRMPRAASEAFAPFRRMSQIEKIAFFS